MFTFLLVVHALIAASLVTVILMQRSEGGGLGMGSGPSGLMTARGAADFLTRATGILATLFVLMAFLLAAIAATRGTGTIDTSLAGQAPAGPITAPQPTSGIPMMGAPTPASPDPLTAQALAPASAGPPSKPDAAAKAATEATEKTTGPIRPRRQTTAADLKTIDTGKADTGTTIGIGGLTSKPAAEKPADKPETQKPAPTPAATPTPPSSGTPQP